MKWAGSVVRAWNRFWFEPDHATNLAAARVILCVHTLWLMLSRDFAAISGVRFVWSGTSGAALARFAVVPGHPEVEGVLQLCAIVALVLGVLGVGARPACFLAGLLVYHLASFETLFRDVAPYGRGLTLAPAMLLLLAAAPSADALAARPSRTSGLPRPGADYGWALKLMQLLVAQIYLFSAYGKLVATGLSWGSAASMRRWLLWANVDPIATTFHRPGLWLADRGEWLLLALGLGTLVLEAGFISVLFARRLRVWVLPITAAFQVILVLTINAYVPEVWLLLLFVDWTSVRPRLAVGGRYIGSILKRAPSSGRA